MGPEGRPGEEGNSEGSRWLTSVILELRRQRTGGLQFEANPSKELLKTNPSQKNPSQKRAGGVSQSVDPEFKPQYWQKKKKEGNSLHIDSFFLFLAFKLWQAGHH
jgi:hypothetical protein